VHCSLGELASAAAGQRSFTLPLNALAKLFDEESPDEIHDEFLDEIEREHSARWWQSGGNLKRRERLHLALWHWRAVLPAFSDPPFCLMLSAHSASYHA
jgi:hypothetical protein